MTQARSSNACYKIDESIQKPLRDKLRTLRLTKGINRSGVRTMSSGSVIRYEETDISSLKLGDAVSLAIEYGMTPDAFFAYLFGNIDYTDVFRKQNADLETITLQARDLSSENQRLLIAMIVTLRDHERSLSLGKELSAIATDQQERKPRVRSKRMALSATRRAYLDATAEASGNSGDR